MQFLVHIQIEWSFNFQASTPTLYVKNKMAEASLLPKEREKIFLCHSRVFLLDFLFQDLDILSREELDLKLSQKISEFIHSFNNSLFICFFSYLVCNFFLYIILVHPGML